MSRQGGWNTPQISVVCGNRIKLMGAVRSAGSQKHPRLVNPGEFQQPVRGLFKLRSVSYLIP